MCKLRNMLSYLEDNDSNAQRIHCIKGVQLSIIEFVMM